MITHFVMLTNPDTFRESESFSLEVRPVSPAERRSMYPWRVVTFWQEGCEIERNYNETRVYWRRKL